MCGPRLDPGPEEEQLGNFEWGLYIREQCYINVNVLNFDHCSVVMIDIAFKESGSKGYRNSFHYICNFFFKSEKKSNEHTHTNIVPPHHLADDDIEHLSHGLRVRGQAGSDRGLRVRGQVGSDRGRCLCSASSCRVHHLQWFRPMRPVDGRMRLENNPQSFFFWSLGLLSMFRLGLKAPEAWEGG